MSTHLSFSISGWIVTVLRCDTYLNLEISNGDMTVVSQVDFDIDNSDELRFRFTTVQIEADYRSDGDAGIPTVEGNITVDDWKIDIVVDNDDHLNLYISSASGVDVDSDNVSFMAS